MLLNLLKTMALDILLPKVILSKFKFLTIVLKSCNINNDDDVLNFWKKLTSKENGHVTKSWLY
jgi:hypothetical protein